MTYLQLVNSVLRRLRENEVDSVNQNNYSKLIGEFVNDAKRFSDIMNNLAKFVEPSLINVFPNIQQNLYCFMQLIHDHSLTFTRSV